MNLPGFYSFFKNTTFTSTFSLSTKNFSSYKTNMNITQKSNHKPWISLLKGEHPAVWLHPILRPKTTKQNGHQGLDNPERKNPFHQQM